RSSLGYRARDSGNRLRMDSARYPFSQCSNEVSIPRQPLLGETVSTAGLLSDQPWLSLEQLHHGGSGPSIFGSDAAHTSCALPIVLRNNIKSGSGRSRVIEPHLFPDFHGEFFSGSSVGLPERTRSASGRRFGVE